MLYDLVGKRLELLKEMVPTLSRVAVFWSPGGQGATLSWKELQLPARQLGLQLHSLEVRNPVDFDKASEDAIAARAGAVFIVAAPVIVTNLKQIAELAAKSRQRHPRRGVDAPWLDAALLVQRKFATKK